MIRRGLLTLSRQATPVTVLSKPIHRVQQKPFDTNSITISLHTIFAQNLATFASAKHKKPGHRIELPKEIKSDHIDPLIKHFKQLGALSPESAKQLLSDAKNHLAPRPALNYLKASPEQPLTVVGDVHGQYFDVLHMFELNGLPSPQNRYLFNGDLVDRGWFGSEILFTLLAIELATPGSVFFNAGNHEADDLCRRYGFAREVAVKYDEPTYNQFLDLFDEFSVAHVLNDSVFVVHGGIPPRKNEKDSLFNLNYLETLPKFDVRRAAKRQTEKVSREQDLVKQMMLWSDPKASYGPQMHHTDTGGGRGQPYGPDASATFLKANKLPPRYCGQGDNRAAFIRFENETDEGKIVYFNHSYDPYVDDNNFDPYCYAQQLHSRL